MEGSISKWCNWEQFVSLKWFQITNSFLSCAFISSGLFNILNTIQTYLMCKKEPWKNNCQLAKLTKTAFPDSCPSYMTYISCRCYFPVIAAICKGPFGNMVATRLPYKWKGIILFDLMMPSLPDSTTWALPVSASTCIFFLISTFVCLYLSPDLHLYQFLLVSLIHENTQSNSQR